MTITLYQFATSPFTEKVRRALSYKGIAYDVHEVERAKVPEGQYKEISPTGKFPVLQHDGKVVSDSTDIIHYLEAIDASNPLVPSDAREAGIAHAIEEWADESLYFYEMTMRLTWEHNLEGALNEFAATMPGIPREELKQRIIKGVGALVGAQGLGRKPRDQIVSDVVRHFAALDGLLESRDWLASDHLTFADLAVVGQLNALLYAVEAQKALDNTKNIKAWMARVDAAAPIGGS